MHKSKTPAFVAGAIVALVLGSGTAFAATGGKFILGHSNKATSVSTLTNSKGTALVLNSKAGTPSLKVNSSSKVPNLNADKVDGLSAADIGRTATYQAVGDMVDASGDGSQYAFIAESYCPGGTQVVGGGIEDMTSTGYQVLNAPDPQNNGWVTADFVDANEDPGSYFAADAVCFSSTGANLAAQRGLASSRPSEHALSLVKKAAQSRQK